MVSHSESMVFIRLAVEWELVPKFSEMILLLCFAIALTKQFFIIILFYKFACLCKKGLNFIFKIMPRFSMIPSKKQVEIHSNLK